MSLAPPQRTLSPPRHDRRDPETHRSPVRATTRLVIVYNTPHWTL